MKRELVKAVLLLVIPVSIVEAYLSASSPFIGYYCFYDTSGRPHCPLYTAEYQAQVGITLSDIFHVRETPKENVFILATDNGTLLRLLFYNENGVLITTTDQGGGEHGGYSFCTVVPFRDGVHMRVRGTLIVPSQWNPVLSTPTMAFAGDLYVFEIPK
jgi:hypothetical protein